MEQGDSLTIHCEMTLNDTTEEILRHLRSFLFRILCFYIHKA